MTAERPPLLVLFDGHGIIFRAYFALPPLTHSKTGESVNAVHGFASMYLKALQDLKPTHVAVAFDPPGRTFRDDTFAEYKATRQATPDDLVSQVARVHDLVDALNCATYEVPGYEADDVIGTLARQAEEHGIPVVVVTGDTDLLQLVTPNTRVLANRGMFSDTVLYDDARVLERYGLRPDQLADYRGLKGDPTDNIPGVPGVGEKTATRLLQEFGSVEGIYDQIDEVQPLKLQERLRQYEAQARLSKQLAAIVRDAPVSLDLDACRIERYDRQKAIDFFRLMEFRSLANRLPGGADAMAQSAGQLAMFPPAEQTAGEAPSGQVVHLANLPHEYRLVSSQAGLEALAARLRGAGRGALAVFAVGPNPVASDLIAIAAATEPSSADVLFVAHHQDPNLPLELVRSVLGPVLADPGVAKVMHNANHAMTILATHGLPVAGLTSDPMLAAYLLNEKGLALKDLALLRLGIDSPSLLSLIGTGSRQIDIARVPEADTVEFAGGEADLTLRLDAALDPMLDQREARSLFRDVEVPLVPVLVEMECNGISLDVPLLREMSEAMAERIRGLELEIYDLCGGRTFNINSTQQLGEILYKELKITDRPPRTKTGFSTDAAVLEPLVGTHPVVQKILDYRQVIKLKSTYVDALPALINPRTGRLHTTFNQTVAATGRLSSSDPNLQNIPIRTDEGRLIRRAFVARGPAGEPWTLVAADYSQIELRIAAHFAQDESLLKAFREEQDIHRATMARVLRKDPAEVTAEERRIAKAVNFGLIYGQGALGLAQVTGMERAEAAAFIQAYFDEYAGVRRYVEQTKALAYEQGYVSTILGRRRYLPDIHSPNRMIRAAAERMAINMPVQGTAADIIKIAMIRVFDRLRAAGLRARMLLQVHDELVFEAPAEEVADLRSLVLEIMPHAIELSVPLRVDVKVGATWGDLE